MQFNFERSLQCPFTSRSSFQVISNETTGHIMLLVLIDSFATKLFFFLLATVHLPRLGYNTPSFNWYGTERLIRKHLASKGIETSMYPHIVCIALAQMKDCSCHHQGPLAFKLVKIGHEFLLPNPLQLRAQETLGTSMRWSVRNVRFRPLKFYE